MDVFLLLKSTITGGTGTLWRVERRTAGGIGAMGAIGMRARIGSGAGLTGDASFAFGSLRGDGGALESGDVSESELLTGIAG